MQESPLLPFHEAAGARLGPAGAATPVLTFGDVPAEYRAGREGCALLDATTRGLVAVTGSDAPTFLHRILANDVRGIEPGGGNANLLLTGKGKVLHWFDLAVMPEGFLLSTQPGDTERLVASLDTYLFAEDVTLEDVSATHAPLELVGPRATAVVEEVLGEAPPTEPHAWVVVDGPLGPIQVTPLTVAGERGVRLAADPAQVADLWEALKEAGATPIGLVAWDSLRAERAWPAWGRDVTDDVYPQEAGLDEAFSLEKGCYVGQEVVAKIDTYGGLNKRLLPLRVSHDDPVETGTRLERDGRDLGVVTTWAYSFAEDGGVVLAYVKRKHQDVGTEFDLGGGATGRIVEIGRGAAG